MATPEFEKVNREVIATIMGDFLNTEDVKER